MGHSEHLHRIDLLKTETRKVCFGQSDTAVFSWGVVLAEASGQGLRAAVLGGIGVARDGIDWEPTGWMIHRHGDNGGE